jgi:hypothetical protein
VCDREAQIWNKFDTAFDTCAYSSSVLGTHYEESTHDEPTPVVPTPVGQNPGNNKPVGNSPFDGEKGEVPSKKDKLKVPPK